MRDCDDPPPPDLIRGIEQFNAGEHFEQHETLELLWRDTSGPARDLYHGILQIGVGLHHWTNGNFHGATVLLAEGIDRLRQVPDRCQSVDVARLRTDATALRGRLLELGSDRMREIDVRRALTVRMDVGA